MDGLIAETAQGEQRESIPRNTRRSKPLVRTYSMLEAESSPFKVGMAASGTKTPSPLAMIRAHLRISARRNHLPLHHGGAASIMAGAMSEVQGRGLPRRRNEMTEINDRDAIIDIEAYAKEGKGIPTGPKIRYRVRIDDTYYIIDHRDPTGRELLTIAGKNPPEGYRLDQKLRGGATKKIGLDEKVDLAQPGVERFKTLPLDATEG
jgi:hypothetical protein